MHFMPTLTLIMPILAYYAYVNGYTLRDNQVSILSKIKSFIDKRCLVNANWSTRKEAMEALDVFINSWYIILPDKKLPSYQLYNYCIEKSQNFSIRLNVFVEKLEPCLESQEKYLKEFIVDGYGDYDHYFCEAISITGEAKVKYFKCIETLDQLERPPLEACLLDSKIFDLAINTYVTKREVCDEFLIMEMCCKKALNDYCPDSKEVWDLFLHTLKDVLKNCT